MDNPDISTLVKGLIETQVIKALNEAPEAIDKLVKAALSKPVDVTTGRSDGYGQKAPYLDYLVGEEIRYAARAAASKVIQEKQDVIEGMIRTSLSSDVITSAITKAFLGASDQEWKIGVTFERDKDR